ncbi:MAG TPA: Ig-like domain-containing protein, partial [Nannocystaceae bacterium]|nr:Ig-like domain-containing protein [Nannocystaceae bacterium]
MLASLRSSLVLAFALVGCSATDVDRLASDRSFEGITDGAVQGSWVTRIAQQYDGTSRTTHHLRIPGGEVELALPPELRIDRDATVRAYGAMDDDGIWQVDDYEIVAPAPTPIIDAVPFAPRNIAVILVQWPEAPGLTNPYGVQGMFESDDSTTVFYGENSYGREQIIGEVFGPYEIADPGGCNPYSIGEMAREAMADNGHDPDAYSQLMYQFPSVGCGFAGLADLGSPQFPARDSWYHSSFGCTVRNQELGHNYGMGHSHSYDCGYDDEGQPIAFDTTCEHIEYGDPYDPMGGGCGHINAVQKLYMGWLDGCNMVSTRGDGTFNLLPLELPCNGTQVLRFPAYDGRWYYLEYRTPIGRFDDSLSPGGVLIHLADELEEYGPSPYILDKVGHNGFIYAGESFTDPEDTVSFTVVETNETHAVIEVTFPDGGTGSPSCKGGDAPVEEAGAVGSLECAEVPYPADVTAPTVAITYPSDGDVFDPGADFIITADVSDDRVIADVVLYLDSQPVERLYAPPWEWGVTNI